MEKPPIPEHRRRREPLDETVDPAETTPVGRLIGRADDLRDSYFTRPVTTFTDVDGEQFPAAVHQAEIDDRDPGNVKVWLKSHGKEITMTIGGILVAAALIKLQRNRSQRKKMSKRQSSYIGRSLGK